MDLNAFKQAAMGVPAAAANNGNSPLSNPASADAIAHIQALASGKFQLGASNAAVDASGGAASTQAQNEADNFSFDHKQKLQDATDAMDKLTQQRKDLEDPKKYIQEISPDGGYKFFDPAGNPISVNDYSKAVGKHVTDVLKDSQNVDDQAFTNDYKNVVELGKLYSNPTKDGFDKLYKEHPELKDYLKNKTYADVVKDFRVNHPDYFNNQSVGSFNSGLATSVAPGTDRANVGLLPR